MKIDQGRLGRGKKTDYLGKKRLNVNEDQHYSIELYLQKKERCQGDCWGERKDLTSSRGERKNMKKARPCRDSFKKISETM